MATYRVPRIVLDHVTGVVASRTPGPLGINDQGDPNVRARIGDTPGPLGINDHADPNVQTQVGRKANHSLNNRWDPVKAAAYLSDPANGWAGENSKGRCAKAVRLAINAGHTHTPNNPISAAHYKDYLHILGFVQVSLKDYSPKVGDIAVFPAILGTKHIHGHIEMFTGERWQSDYLQKERPRDGSYGKGFFAAEIWSKKPFYIFRKEVRK